MWFKLYCVDEFYFAPSVLSKIGYVELINNEGKAALRSKIDLSEGLGSGSLYYLPTCSLATTHLLRIPAGCGILTRSFIITSR